MQSPEASITLSFDRGTLLLRGCDAPMPGWTLDSRVGCLRTQAIHYAEARRALNEAFDGRWTDTVRVPPRVAWSKCELKKLRPEQRQAVDAWGAAGGRGMIVMPTGAGKTEVALAIMAEQRIATLIVAPVRDLMHQWHRRIYHAFGYDAGIVGDSFLNPQPITVTTYDSAYARMPQLGDRYGLIIFDEAHHLPGKCYREAALLCTAPLRMGLTATPERGDGAEADLETLIGPTVFRQEIGDARGRSLADYDVVRIPVHLADDEQQNYERAGKIVQSFIIRKQQVLQEEFQQQHSDAAQSDIAGASAHAKPPAYTWQQLCAESGEDPEARRALKAYFFKKSIEDRASEKLRVLEDLFRLHAGQKVMIFAGSNAMAIDVSQRFLVPTLLSHSRKRERREVLDGFADGRFPVLVANQVLDEGVDVPTAKVAVVIGGMSSTRQAKQRLGRILRRSGDQRATLYEIVCQGTNDEERSRKRRRSDAYEKVKRTAAVK